MEPSWSHVSAGPAGFWPAYYSLDVPFEPGPGQHHPPPAGQATHADVGPHPRHGPFRPPARVGLAHLNHVANPDI